MTVFLSGVTANKEILRLLREFLGHRQLIQSVLKPLWDTRTHDDLRRSLLLTAIDFLGQSQVKDTDDHAVLWQMIDEASRSAYLPLVQCLFTDTSNGGSSSSPLMRMKYSCESMYRVFVNQVQMKILDHSTSSEARSWAWSNIDHQYADRHVLVDKAQHVCLQFDRDSKACFKAALDMLIAMYKQEELPRPTTEGDVLTDVIDKLIDERERIDGQANGLDAEHDLPVYHRLQTLLSTLIRHVDDMDLDKRTALRSLIPKILRFDPTLSSRMAELAMRLVPNKEELQEVLGTFESKLSASSFDRLLNTLSTLVSGDSCPCFIQTLNVDEKLRLAQWFTAQSNRELFVWDWLIKGVFDQSGVDRERCRQLLIKFRQSDNLFAREQALGYTVPWPPQNTA